MNHFAQLSGGDGAKFLVRWRGRQEGPFSAPVIEAKLAANEIGLLHEIFHDGRWVTIRDYVTEREAAIEAGRRAMEERALRAREEEERLAKEKEALHRAKLLAAEERKNGETESELRRQIRDYRPEFSALPEQSRPARFRIVGGLLAIAGLAIAGYFLFAFDPSVSSGAGRVNNLGLMADRQNGIIVGVGLGVIGAILLALGPRGKK